MKHILITLGVCGAVLAAARPTLACSLQAPPQPVFTGRSSLVYLWEGADSSGFWLPGGAPPHPLREYLERVRAAVRDVDPGDPWALIDRQRALYLAHLGAPAVRNYDVMASGLTGAMTAARCLDQLLLSFHLTRWPAGASAGEFAAHILARPGRSGERRLRIILHSVPEAMIPREPRITALLAESRAQGWQLIEHLHNHPFAFANPHGDHAGVCMPSGELADGSGDLGAYARMRAGFQVERFAITNGFSTFHLPAGELERFH
jgi:hypothetical protein